MKITHVRKGWHVRDFKNLGFQYDQSLTAGRRGRCGDCKTLPVSECCSKTLSFPHYLPLLRRIRKTPLFLSSLSHINFPVGDSFCSPSPFSLCTSASHFLSRPLLPSPIFSAQQGGEACRYPHFSASLNPTLASCRIHFGSLLSR